MTDAVQHTPLARLRGFSLRQLRLVSGMVLFSYLLSHFLNHALGNVSLAAMDWGLLLHLRFWHAPSVSLVFYSAAAIHTSLGIWALYERRQFHRATIEPLQLILGLSIPVLIVAHVVNMRLSGGLFGQERGYEQTLHSYWVAAPVKMWLSYLTILIAWIHGCIGLYFWLRLKRLFKPLAPWLLALAVLIPTLAVLGLFQAGRSVMRDSAAPDWKAQYLTPETIGTPDQQRVLDDVTNGLLLGYVVLLGLALAGRGGRALLDRRGGMINLSYGSGRTIRVPKGLSVLEASLRFQMPHASVCGGRARCSTCRIRVIGDCHTLPAPSGREAFVLDRVGASGDPAVRLACQLRPTTDVAFVQLFLPPAVSTRSTSAPVRSGQERYLVSMFIDMRGSTSLAEKRLPFDTVFIVNRFLGAVSQAVIAAGGQPNQFVGDGMLALFGLDTEPATACRQALQGAAMIAAHVEELNQFLKHDLPEPLRFGIGIHAGEVIIGDIGYRDHMVFTALGDAVNVAARLQDMTKTLACEAVVSEAVFETAGLPTGTLPAHDVAIRGRIEPMVVRAINSGELGKLMTQAAIG